MEIKLERKPIDQVEADAIIIPVFDKESEGGGLSGASAFTANRLTGGWIEETYASGEFSGKALETAILHRPAGMRAKRLVLAGAGKSKKFTDAVLRNVTGAALRALKEKGAKSLAIAVDAGDGIQQRAAAAVEGAILANYEPDRYKTERKDEPKTVESFAVVAPADAQLQDALRRAQVIAESQNFTRELANEPANRMTPLILAERARQMAAADGLECEVLDQARMTELGMGALLGVAQGSAEPPALIIVRYRPSGAESKTHLALVGKGVTFDTGGISIKPSEGMDKMKYDMSGGAAVLGAMRAIAQLKPAIAVTAFVPAVENMPGGRAQRPGDIVTTLSGKTVEVLNTDAEGRLILADALTYAQRLGCTHLVDAATLTGAIVVALGHVNTGVFANDGGFRDRVMEAARREGEKMWAMPLDEDYKEALKSAFADIPNIGNRWGGAITAALFLKEFADPAPWVHLDIAGTAYLDDAKPYLAKGPAGMPVRTLVELALSWKE